MQIYAYSFCHHHYYLGQLSAVVQNIKIIQEIPGFTGIYSRCSVSYMSETFSLKVQISVVFSASPVHVHVYLCIDSMNNGKIMVLV